MSLARTCPSQLRSRVACLYRSSSRTSSWIGAATSSPGCRPSIGASANFKQRHYRVPRCPGTTVAIDSPEQIGLVTPLLGYTAPGTAQRHYNLARGMEAAAAWHDALASIADQG